MQPGSGIFPARHVESHAALYPGHTLPAATAPVIVAVGLALLDKVPGLAIDKGVVKVDRNMMAGYAGIFARGDMVPSERTVTVAIGHGKKAARNIDAWLRGGAYVAPEKHEVARFDYLNTWYYADAPKTVQPMLDIIRRQSSFDEVLGGLDASTALFEARRCLSYRNCFECANCYGACPDNAAVKLGLGKRFEFNLDYCMGCGPCEAECPCGAIAMVPETI
jgi:Pyruvate/2-oxoacid:ferredoxin oxidoreductase delta subunit